MALVLLRYYSTTMEAEVARGFLSTRGVLAFNLEDDCSTIFPALARLMVAEEDFDNAVAVLDSIVN